MDTWRPASGYETVTSTLAPVTGGDNPRGRRFDKIDTISTQKPESLV